MSCDVPLPLPHLTTTLLDAPVDARVLRVIDHGLEPVATTDPATAPEPVAATVSSIAGPEPWVTVARTGAPLALTADDIGDAALDAIRELFVGRATGGADVAGVECHPIWSDGTLAGVVVALVTSPVSPVSPVGVDRAIESGRRVLGVDASGADAPTLDSVTGARGPACLDELRTTGDADRDVADAVFLSLDLDGLDAINRSYGPAGGDAVLSEVARRLERIVRDDDLVVRTVGDEFVVVIRGADDLASIRLVAAAVDALALPYGVGADGAEDDAGDLVSVTAGVGMCVPSEGTSVDLALHTARLALDEAKRSGRDHLHIIGC